MTKEEAIAIWGNGPRTATALGITRQAVNQWPSVLTRSLADRVVGAAIRTGAASIVWHSVQIEGHPAVGMSRSNAGLGSGLGGDLWVSMTDRQPQYLEHVLFLWGKGFVFSGWLWGDEGCSPDCLIFGIGAVGGIPTHWMPLPDAPNASQNTEGQPSQVDFLVSCFPIKSTKEFNNV